ncbi:MAG: WG repeat-containing protein [Oscillospiraceae bacterium]|nr:WG repeat-containing protein [Oscillospiraceae bacterium]
MKRLFAFILAALMLLTIAACGSGQEVKTSDGEASETPGAETSTILVPYYDEETEKYGYCTIEGEKKIEPQFDYASSFAENGLAAVKVDYKYGYINEKGEIIQPK